MATENLFRPVYGLPHYKSQPGESNSMISALLQREPKPEETVLIARGKIFTSTRTKDPTIQELKNSPKEILFMPQAPIEMWIAVLKVKPEFAKFSPLACGNVAFVNAYSNEALFKSELLLHLPSDTEQKYIFDILEQVNFTPRELSILIKWFPYRLPFNIIMRSIRAYAGKYEYGKPKMGYYAAIKELYHTVQDQERKITIIITCLRLLNTNSIDEVQPMVTDMLHALKYEGDVDRLIIALRDYIHDHPIRKANWLNDIIDTMPSSVIQKFIYALRQKNIYIDDINLKYINFELFRFLKMPTNQEKIKAIEAICGDIKESV